MHRVQIIIATLSFLLLIGVAVASLYFYSSGLKTLPATIGGEELFLEIADTEAVRTKGLSWHKPLAPNEGMLFVFPKDGFYGFWMKDMLFSIDMLWLDRDYRIVDVKERASPESYPEGFTPRVPARYVLELSAGFFELHGLKKGDKLEFAI